MCWYFPKNKRYLKNYKMLAMFLDRNNRSFGAAWSPSTNANHVQEHNKWFSEFSLSLSLFFYKVKFPHSKIT